MEDDKEMKERDFHHGEGHAIPFFIKLAWTIYWISAITYLAVWMVPALMERLGK